MWIYIILLLYSFGMSHKDGMGNALLWIWKTLLHWQSSLYLSDDNGMCSTVGVAKTLSHATHDRFLQSYYYCLNEKVENKMTGCLHGNVV